MNHPYPFGPDKGEKIVYVREVAVADLPEDVREQVPGVEFLYSVHRTDGERVALVKDREMAFLLAREHEFAPVSVH